MDTVGICIRLSNETAVFDTRPQQLETDDPTESAHPFPDQKGTAPMFGHRLPKKAASASRHSVRRTPSSSICIRTEVLKPEIARYTFCSSFSSFFA